MVHPIHSMFGSSLAAWQIEWRYFQLDQIQTREQGWRKVNMVFSSLMHQYLENVKTKVTINN